MTTSQKTSFFTYNGVDFSSAFRWKEFDEYLDYMSSLLESHPLHARDFFNCFPRYDLSDKSLHDSRIRSFSIDGESTESINLQICFLGSYHDRLHEFYYLGVDFFDLGGVANFGKDVDIHFLDRIENFWVHVIKFDDGGHTIVVSNDIRYKEVTF